MTLGVAWRDRISRDRHTPYDEVIDRLSRWPYPSLRRAREKLTKEIGMGWRFTGIDGVSRRVFFPVDRDRLLIAWINAEMARRVIANPTVKAYLPKYKPRTPKNDD